MFPNKRCNLPSMKIMWNNCWNKQQSVAWFILFLHVLTKHLCDVTMPTHPHYDTTWAELKGRDLEGLHASQDNLPHPPAPSSDTTAPPSDTFETRSLAEDRASIGILDVLSNCHHCLCCSSISRYFCHFYQHNLHNPNVSGYGVSRFIKI